MFFVTNQFGTYKKKTIYDRSDQLNISRNIAKHFCHLTSMIELHIKIKNCFHKHEKYSDLNVYKFAFFWFLVS